MTRPFSLCVLLSQMALALFLFGERRGEIAFAFGPFFAAHKLLAWYLVGINLAAFAAFAATSTCFEASAESPIAETI